MSQNPINLTVRFLLELAALAALGIWGLQQSEGGLRFLWGLGLPLFAALIWGIFRDEDHRGPAPVRVPGVVRLAYEFVMFGFAVWAVYDVGATALSWSFGAVIVLHYALSYDRILRLLRP